MTVNGTGFLSGSYGFAWRHRTLATTFVSATQVTALVPASLIAQPGPQPVTATNPGSVASNPLPLAINPPVPTITSISPSTVTAGGPGFTLTVIGTNFLPGATVSLNSMQLNSTAVSSTQITAQVTPNLIGQPGTAQIAVANAGRLAVGSARSAHYQFRYDHAHQHFAVVSERRRSDVHHDPHRHGLRLEFVGAMGRQPIGPDFRLLPTPS